MAPHTAARILINEHAGPDVASGAERPFDSSGPYRHAEGRSDSHAKSVLGGTTIFVFAEDGKLVSRPLAGHFFAEFDGPRGGHLHVKVLPGRV